MPDKSGNVKFLYTRYETQQIDAKVKANAMTCAGLTSFCASLISPFQNPMLFVRIDTF